MKNDFNVNNYKISLGTHRDKDVIFFEFPNILSLRNQLRMKLKVQWSKSNKKWYALDMPQYRRLLDLPLEAAGEKMVDKIHPVNVQAFLTMREELILRGYSPNTQKVYLSEFFQFLSILKHHSAQNLPVEKIRSYLVYCSERLKLKEATLHSRVNALKFYYEQVIHIENLFSAVPRPKKPSQLPKVLSKTDLKKMFELTENPKHLLILKLVYGMGLRVSEIVGLKVKDIDGKRMKVHIQYAKGKKDRYVPLPHSIMDELRAYYRSYNPKEYLFEGQTGGQYTIRSVQQVFKNAMLKAKINKKIGIHGLRHSYATHLLEAGTDTLFIKELLGHRDIKTTMIYTKVSDKSLFNIVSPLDDL
jgi:site-specific recombinase XerD